MRKDRRRTYLASLMLVIAVLPVHGCWLEQEALSLEESGDSESESFEENDSATDTGSIDTDTDTHTDTDSPPSGAFKWVRQIVEEEGGHLTSVSVLSDDTIFVVGRYKGPTYALIPESDAVGFDTNEWGFFGSKYTPDGELLWIRRLYEDAENVPLNLGITSSVTNTNNILIVAHLFQGAVCLPESDDAFVVGASGSNSALSVLLLNDDGEYLNAWNSMAGGSIDIIGEITHRPTGEAIFNGRFLGPLQFEGPDGLMVEDDSEVYNPAIIIDEEQGPVDHLDFGQNVLGNVHYFDDDQVFFGGRYDGNDGGFDFVGEEYSLPGSSSPMPVIAKYTMPSTFDWVMLFEDATAGAFGSVTDIEPLAGGELAFIGFYQGGPAWAGMTLPWVDSGTPGRFMGVLHNDGTAGWMHAVRSNNPGSSVEIEKVQSLFDDLFFHGRLFGTAIIDHLDGTEEELVASSPGQAFYSRISKEGELKWRKHIHSTTEVTIENSAGLSDGRIAMIGSFKGSSTFGVDEPSETTLHAIDSSPDDDAPLNGFLMVVAP